MAITDLKNSLANAIGWPTTPMVTGGGGSGASGIAAQANVYTDNTMPSIFHDPNHQTRMVNTLREAMERNARTETLTSESWRRDAINMRLRNTQGSIPKGLSDLKTSFSADKVFVFIVTGDKAVVLEDEAGMFPSDTLITQIRLLQE